MTKTNETRVAEEIVEVMGSAVRLCSDDRDSVRFAVRAEGLALRMIVFARAALRKLAVDPIKAIKVEYLQRDILRAASHRAEYRYPRKSRVNAVIRRNVAMAV